MDVKLAAAIMQEPVYILHLSPRLQHNSSTGRPRHLSAPQPGL